MWYKCATKATCNMLLLLAFFDIYLFNKNGGRLIYFLYGVKVVILPFSCRFKGKDKSERDRKKKRKLFWRWLASSLQWNLIVIQFSLLLLVLLLQSRQCQSLVQKDNNVYDDDDDDGPRAWDEKFFVVVVCIGNDKNKNENDDATFAKRKSNCIIPWIRNVFWRQMSLGNGK